MLSGLKNTRRGRTAAGQVLVPTRSVSQAWRSGNDSNLSFTLFLNGNKNEVDRSHLLVFKDNRERVVVDIFDVSLREKHRDRIKSHEEAQDTDGDKGF